VGLPKKKKRLRFVYGILVGLLVFSMVVYVLLPSERGPRVSLVSSSSKVLCFVLGDVGESVAALDPFLAFPGPLTVSVLPFLPRSQRCALAAVARGKEVILRPCRRKVAKILGLAL
jgi:hypothetical protein